MVRQSPYLLLLRQLGNRFVRGCLRLSLDTDDMIDHTRGVHLVARSRLAHGVASVTAYQFIGLANLPADDGAVFLFSRLHRSRQSQAPNAERHQARSRLWPQRIPVLSGSRSWMCPRKRDPLQILERGWRVGTGNNHGLPFWRRETGWTLGTGWKAARHSTRNPG